MSEILGIEVKGRRLMELCCIIAFNELRIKIGGTPIHYDDTEATYSLSIDSGVRVSKPRRAELLAVLRGVIACYRAM